MLMWGPFVIRCALRLYDYFTSLPTISLLPTLPLLYLLPLLRTLTFLCTEHMLYTVSTIIMIPTTPTLPSLPTMLSLPTTLTLQTTLALTRKPTLPVWPTQQMLILGLGLWLGITHKCKRSLSLTSKHAYLLEMKSIKLLRSGSIVKNFNKSAHPRNRSLPRTLIIAK